MQQSAAPSAPADKDSCGFVFATSGAPYTVMARRAARTLRQVMPGWPVDLYTDQPVTDATFDRIFPLERHVRMPKIEALRRSRFARTIYLDADVIPLADLSDIFRLLDQAELAATHVQYRTCPPGGKDPDIPAAFPQLNAGLIGVRANPATQAFLQEWEELTLSAGAYFDQFLLRRLLYRGDVRLAVLPPEYNFIRLVWLEAWDSTMGAPRLLHLGHLKAAGTSDPELPFDAATVIGPRLAHHLRRLIAADPALGGSGARVAAPVRVRLRHLLAGVLRRWTGRG
jgi:hypothetical protein